MYVPEHFARRDAAGLAGLIEAQPLGMLVTQGPGGLDANHVPFLLEPREAGGPDVLRCHVARANPVWRELVDGAPVLVVFRGPDGYVSPNWYPSKPATHRVVPTWNYAVVHVHGAASVRDDATFVRGVVARLTRRFEAETAERTGAGAPQPWRMGDAPADYLDTMIAAIVGIEITIDRLEGKGKLSQNRTAADQAGVITGLRGVGNAALADAMMQAGDAPGEPPVSGAAPRTR